MASFISSPSKGLRAGRHGILRGLRGVGSGNDGRNGTTTATRKEQVERMRKELLKQSDDKRDGVDAWEALWSQGVTPWDLGGPTRTLISELERKHREEPVTLLWKTALIPGCGSGYDLVSLARFWDSMHETDISSIVPIERTVIGLDVSPTSLERAKTQLLEARDSGGHKRFPTTDIQLFLGDFFEDPLSWTLFHSEKSAKIKVEDDNVRGSQPRKTFDFIFDYTFFCAIPPSRRREWGQQMTRLLTKAVRCDDNQEGMIVNEVDQRWQHPVGGQLLTLMFPCVPTSRPDSPGPPYLVSFSDYQESLHGIDDCNDVTNPRKALLHLTTKHPYYSKDTVPTRRGQELVGWWAFETLTAPSELLGGENRSRL